MGCVMPVFKINDLELTTHLIEIKKGLSEASAAFRNGYLNDMISALADIENHARQAGWRAIDVRKTHGPGKLAPDGNLDKAQPE